MTLTEIILLAVAAIVIPVSLIAIYIAVRAVISTVNDDEEGADNQ